jgi:hypothetical protein
MKSQIVKRSTEAQLAAHVVELEKANAELQAELDPARSKSTEVEHREQALTSEYNDPKKDFESVHTVYDAVVKEKAEIEENERVKLQHFQDSHHKKMAELRRCTEASVEGVRSTRSMLLCLIFCIGSMKRLQCFQPPLQNVTRILLAMPSLLSSRCLQGKDASIFWSSKSWLFLAMLRSFRIFLWKLVG